jgi:hypothetical protein
MTIAKAVFWNKEQGRLHAGFRIVIQLTIFFIAMKSLAALLCVSREITDGRIRDLEFACSCK